MDTDARAERLNVDPKPAKDGERTNLTRVRGARTREVILEEAANLFSKYGYRGTSLRDISERVGISHPGMLHHFSHKDALLQAVLDRAAVFFEDMIDGFVSAAQNPVDIRDWQAERQYQSFMFAIVRAEALEESHPGRERIMYLQTMAEEKLTKLFEMYEENGWLDDGVEPAWAARSTVAMWTGVFTRYGLFDDKLFDYDLSVFIRLFVKPLREVDPLMGPEQAQKKHQVSNERMHQMRRQRISKNGQQRDNHQTSEGTVQS